jgi:methionyl-tRNA synthetase
VLAKGDQKELARVLYALPEMIRHLGLLLKPFLPETSQKIFAALAFDADKLSFGKVIKWGLLEAGTSVKKPEQLFARVEA